MPKSHFRFPGLKASESDILDYVKRFFDEKSRYRLLNMTRMSRNLWMIKHGRHWIEVDKRIAPTAGGYKFVDTLRNGKRELPRPVDNRVGEGHKNLVARLMRKQYEPSPRATGQKTELQAAAKLQKEILLHDADEADFENAVELKVVDQLVAGGTACGRSILDERFDALNPEPVTEAMQCASCSSVLASSKVGREMVDGSGLMGLDQAEDFGGDLGLKVCPKCGDPGLGSYAPSMEEAKDGMDMFQRPLGVLLPRVEAIWEYVSPWELWPENGGIVDTDKCKIMGQRTPRSMEWVEAHVRPEFLAKIEPEDPKEIMKAHPTLGDPWFSGAKNADEVVYANHVLPYELTAEPMQSEGMEEGRRIVVIGDKIVHNGPLMKAVPHDSESKVASVVYSVGVVEPVDGEFWGKTPIDDAVPLNMELNRLNAIDEDLRERGVPFVAMPEGVDFRARNETATGAMRVFQYDDSARANFDIGKAIQVPPTGSVNHADRRTALIEAIQSKIGPMPVESGAAGGADSAIQLQQQAQEAAAKLGPIDQARVRICKKLFEHHADLVWAFRQEGEYERKNEAGEYEKQSYQNTQLVGRCKVDMDVKAATEPTVLEIALAEKATLEGFYGDPVSMDQGTKDDLAKMRGLPTLDTSQSIQVRRADKAWSDFVRDRVIPYIDTTIDDVWIWYQRLGKHWQGDEARKLLAEVDWDNKVLRGIAGWERKYDQAVLQDEQQKAIYEGHPPEQWDAIYNEATGLAKKVEQTAEKVTKETGVPTAPPPQIAAPPVTGEFLPESVCDRLLMLWRGMLNLPDPAAIPPALAAISADPLLAGAVVPSDAMGQMVQAAAQMNELDSVLRMYAVIQECRIEDRNKKQAAAAGMMQPASPGGSMTPAGNAPMPGAPVVPGPGAAGVTA
jgi:hypothetical protein